MGAFEKDAEWEQRETRNQAYSLREPGLVIKANIIGTNKTVPGAEKLLF